MRKSNWFVGPCLCSTHYIKLCKGREFVTMPYGSTSKYEFFLEPCGEQTVLESHFHPPYNLPYD